jgi:hypothetical protein
MRPPDLYHPGLHHRAHLMRTAMRPPRPIGQTIIGGIPAQPGMDALPRHLEPARHLNHRGAVQHLPHRPQPLLCHPQLLKHHRPLPQSMTTTEEPTNQASQQPLAGQSVKHLPERLSRRNRNRVPKLSTSYRNPMVKHEPELHTEGPPVYWRLDKWFPTLTGVSRLALVGSA